MRFTPVLVLPFLLLAASCHEGKPADSPGTLTSAKNGGALAFALQESPISLTASDGTGLKLTSMEANAVVDGGLAFTELHLTFENPQDRTLEGTFRVSLPQGASLGRFAMKIGKEWQEGEVVELAAARRAYEDALHRKQDPALMEKAAGNEFSARVFPIPARGTKEITVAWVEEIQNDRYVLPLRGLPEVGLLDASVTVRGAKTTAPRLHETNSAPRNDFVVDLASEKSNAKVTAIRNGELALLRVRPQTETKPEPLGSTVVLVDTSASRALGFDGEIEIVKQIAAKVAAGARDGKSGTLTVACFDQRVTQVFQGKASEFGDRELSAIRAHGALGASDVERALSWANDAAKKNGAKRVVLVSDGVATAGATDPKRLREGVARLRGAGVERLDAVAIGGIRDDEGLLRLVRGNLAHDGVVASASQPDVLRRLGEATCSNVPVKIEGANWSWPAKLDGVQAGDTFSVYVEIPAKKSELRVSVGDAAAEVVAPRVTERPLLERAVAQAQVASMLERETTSKESLKKNIISLATRNRILTPYTAMLVLETDQDYARFGIDRRAPGDILAIDDGKVRRVHREALAIPSDKLVVDVLKDAAKETDTDGSLDGAPGASVAQNDPTGGGAPARSRGAASASPPAVAAAPPPAPVMRADAREKKTMAPLKAAPRMEAEAMAEPQAARPMSRPRPARGSAPAATIAPRSPSAPMEIAADDSVVTETDTGPVHGKAPYEGRLATIMDMIKAKALDRALAEARSWHDESPGDVLALVGLGEAAEAKGDLELAERAYGSVIDLFGNRADMRRFAGERLERIGAKDPAALDLAIDTFEKALADRPDHPASHRLLTFALVRKKQYAKAFDVAVAASQRQYEPGRFRGVDRILSEDVGLVGAAWSAAEPTRRDEIEHRVQLAGGHVENAPSVRFVLNWETDANDVDFHIHDAKGGHAYFSAPHLASGGDLYADVTTGYGPECFTIRAPKGKRVGSYHLEAHYYSRGPMGYGMGKLEVIDHDGKGGLSFEERPFLVMVDQAYVDIGTVQ